MQLSDAIFVFKLNRRGVERRGLWDIKGLQKSIRWRYLIADNILKTFSLSYKHVILGCYIKDRSLKDVGFIINFIFM